MNNYFETVHQIIKAGHWITDQISRELRELDATEPQYNVLRILVGAKGQPLTVQEIQAKMIQRSSNVTRIIDRLLSKDLVNRQECPTNRRKMDITITEKGQEALKDLDKKVTAFHDPLKKRLDTEELNTLKLLIEKLTNNAHK
ncbi:MAG: MarR family transcriptional regulator [Bacteroidota bacterium]